MSRKKKSTPAMTSEMFTESNTAVAELPQEDAKLLTSVEDPTEVSLAKTYADRDLTAIEKVALEIYVQMVITRGDGRTGSHLAQKSFEYAEAFLDECQSRES